MDATEETMNAIGNPADGSFVISHVFDAPRERLWQAWSERDRLTQWFGPKGTTIAAARMDFRPGGGFHYCMRTGNDNAMWGRFVYREIVILEKIVLVSSFSDEQGGLTRHPLSETWPLEMFSTMWLARESGNRTKLTIECSPLEPTEAESRTFASSHHGMRLGWSGAFEQLAAYLAKSR